LRQDASSEEEKERPGMQSVEVDDECGYTRGSTRSAIVPPEGRGRGGRCVREEGEEDSSLQGM
jgi:hypothetical protein